jgi:hypothetical protein
MTATYNLVCPQATTFTFQFQVSTDGTPWNLNGYAVTMTIRPFLGSTTTTLTATITNGRVTVDGPNGRITVVLPASITNLSANSYVYDVVLDSGSEINRILEGQFIVTAGVTV